MDVLALFKKAPTAILVVRTLTPLHMHRFKLSLPTTAHVVTSWTGCDEDVLRAVAVPLTSAASIMRI